MRKTNLPLFRAVMLALGIGFGFVTQAQTNPAAQTLSYSQDFGTSTFTSVPAGCAAWTVSGAPLGSQSAAESSVPNADAAITAATAIQSTGGCYGFSHLSNGFFYIQNDNNADGTNQLACAVNTAGWSGLTVSYDIVMLAAGQKTAGIVLQYRNGTSGSWTSISGAVYAHNGGDRAVGAVDHFTSLTLPAAANNQPVVQLRWASWAGSETGKYSGVLIDNISVSGSCNITSASGFTASTGIPAVEQQTTTEKWYSFTAQNTNVGIELDEQYMNPASKMLSAALWGGTCTTAVKLFSDTITGSGDSTLHIAASGLGIGNTYYLQVIQSSAAGTLEYTAAIDNASGTPCTGNHDGPAMSCNMVANGDFEYNNGLIPPDMPGGYSYVHLACPWEQPSGGSSDYFTTSSPSSTCGIPLNHFGNQSDHTPGNNAYTGFYAYLNPNTGVPGYKEYVYQPLKCQLIAGVRYHLSFYVSLSDGSYFSTNSIGACLTSAPPTFTGVGSFPVPIGVTPKFDAAHTGFYNDKTNWMPYDVDFTATGNEQYIIIGDFGNGTSTNVQNEIPVPSPPGFVQYPAYYYLDDVSLTPYNEMTISSTDPIVCPNLPVILSNSLGAALTWGPEENIDASAPDFPFGYPVSPSTTFSGTLTYCNGCTYTAYTTVDVYHADAGSDAFICRDDNTTLNGSGGGTYSWAPAAGLSATNIANPVASPSVTTTYTLTVVGGPSNCTFTDEVTVTVDDLPEPVITGPPSCYETATTYTISNYNSSNTYTILLLPLSPSPGTASAINTATGTFTVTWNSSAGGSILVNTTNTNGCMASGSLDLTAGFCECSGTPITSASWNTGTGFSLPSSGGPYALYFDVDVPSGSNLTLTDDIISIAPGVTITVEPGATLTLDNCHLYACTDMWAGIVLNPGGYLNVINGTLIEDAYDAIFTQPTTGTDIPHLDVDGAIFNKNGIAININDNTNDMSSNTIKNSVFTCRTFPGAVPPAAGSFATIKADFVSNSLSSYPTTTTIAGNRSQIGVSFNAVQPPTPGPDYYAKVGDPAVSSDVNVFDNLDQGIYLLGSECEIQNNQFQNLVGYEPVRCRTCPIYIPSGIGIYAPAQTILDKNWVRIGGTTAAKGNSFTDCYRGIDISNYEIVYAEYNQFMTSATPFPFPAASPTIGETGIYLRNNRKQIHLYNNTMHDWVNEVRIIRNTTLGGSVNPEIVLSSNDLEATGAGYCTQAISISDAALAITAQPTFHVYNNYIYDVDNGIKVENIFNRIMIHDNPLINLRYHTGTVQRAIWLENCDVSQVINNPNISTSHGTYGGSDNFDISGIYVHMSTNNKIDCNNLFSLGQCMVFNDNCNSPTASGYGVLYNTMNNARTGITLENGGVIGQQGDASTPCGNNFSSPSAFTDGQTYTISSAPTSSILYCDASQLPSFNGGTPPYSSGGGTPSLYTTSGTLSAFCPETVSHAPGRMAAAATGNESSTSVQLYPNPNKGNMVLEYTLLPGDKGMMNIYDLQGKLVKAYTLGNASPASLDASDLEDGVYIYEVLINDQKVKSDKLVIIR